MHLQNFNKMLTEGAWTECDKQLSKQVVFQCSINAIHTELDQMMINRM